MSANGYVVRGKHGGSPVYAIGEGEWLDDGGPAPLFETVPNADDARDDLTYGGCTDVRILRVAEDGTETPLPSYEEALARSAAWERYALALVTNHADWAATMESDVYTPAVIERRDKLTAEVSAAEEALRALGVDVDGLLKGAT